MRKIKFQEYDLKQQDWVKQSFFQLITQLFTSTSTILVIDAIIGSLRYVYHYP